MCLIEVDWKAFRARKELKQGIFDAEDHVYEQVFAKEKIHQDFFTLCINALQLIVGFGAVQICKLKRFDELSLDSGNSKASLVPQRHYVI